MRENNFKILLPVEFLRLKILLTLIYIALEIYYQYFISDNFRYMGYEPDLSIVNYIITKFIYIGFMMLSFRVYKNSRFLYAIFLLLLFFFYIPNAIMFSFSSTAIGPFVSNVFFVGLFSFTPYVRFNFGKLFQIKKRKEIAIIGLSLLLLIPIALTFKTDINLRTLMLQEVYETRELFSARMTSLLSYIYNLQVKTIIPIALIFFMIRKRLLLVGLMAIILLYLYVISGNKIVYFTTFILIFFYYLGASYVSKTSNFFIITLVLLIATPFVDNFLFHAPILGGTFINRFLFIPALLTQWYFEFFDGVPYFFAESNFFNQFVESPYDMPVGFLLTKIYWGEPTVFANNGVVSDGFMNLGYFGVILFSVIFSLTFSLINSFKLNKGYFGLFFGYVYMMLSVPFMSAYITGGILVFLLISLFLLRENEGVK